MATSYTFVLCIPVSVTYPQTPILVAEFSQYGSSIGYSGITACNNIAELIDEIFLNVYAPNYGGSWTISTQSDGSFYTHTIQYTGLTSDPEPTSGQLIGFYVTLNPSPSSHFGYVLQDCPAEPTTCDTCKQVTVKACQASYTLTTGLTPATTYTVALHAGNGNTYTQEVTTDGSGNITIDAAAVDFPEGFWVPESGGYVLKVYPNNDLDTPEDLTIDAVVYTCIQLNFTYVTTTT